MASPRGRIADLEASILRTRADQRALQKQLAEAIEQEHRALAMVDAARALQARCHRLIDEHADAISSLQDEIAEVVPEQRPAAD